MLSCVLVGFCCLSFVACLLCCLSSLPIFVPHFRCLFSMSRYCSCFFLLCAVVFAPICFVADSFADSVPRSWRQEFPKTDFAKRSISLDSVISGGPPRDAIAPIDAARVLPLDSSAPEVLAIGAREPVLSLTLNGESRTYPLRFLIWHEIVNDTLGGKKIVATFCPLCNSAIVFDAAVEGRALSFSTTGRLRNSDLLMYDRETESWWQQFLGEAVIGKLTGKKLTVLPSQLESWAQFQKRHPRGTVALPPKDFPRAYGENPYARYDSLAHPFLYRGALPEGIPALARVVSLANRKRAIALSKLRQTGSVRWGEVVLEWREGQASALDHGRIERGKEVGSVYAWREKDGERVAVVYFVDFAFAFHAFFPKSVILK